MSTKNKILDAAEVLFADKGFNGTSLREITSYAEVNLAAVNYHFGSKKGVDQSGYVSLYERVSSSFRVGINSSLS